MVDFFVYNSMTGILEFNEPCFLLIDEFSKLYEQDRNKCKEDKKGERRLLARKEFTYMWLKMNPKSPYSQYTEKEAHLESLKDSHLTKEQYDDPLFREACKKYIALRDSDRIGKMLRAAYNKVDDITDYLDNELDLTERIDGKPVFRLKDVISEMKQLGDVITGIKSLELAYQKEQEAKSDIRAGAIAGFRD